MNRIKQITDEIKKLEDELEEEQTTLIRINGRSMRIIADLDTEGRQVYTRIGAKWLSPIRIVGVEERESE